MTADRGTLFVAGTDFLAAELTDDFFLCAAAKASCAAFRSCSSRRDVCAYDEVLTGGVELRDE